MIYTSTIEGVDVIILPTTLNEYREYDEDASFEVKWSIEIEGRSWGIKSISPSISSIIGTVSFSEEGADIKTIDIDTLTDLDWKIEIAHLAFHLKP